MEWIFSGIGVFVLSGIFWLFHRIFFYDSPRNNGESTDKSKEQYGGLDTTSNVIHGHWHGILPHQSRYKFKSETRKFIPLGLQLYSFEYGPRGHTNALILGGLNVCAEIQFTCRIDNPYKALFAANDYALNVLPPIFLSQARSILENYSLAELRMKRQEASHDIMLKLSPQFDDIGVRLESVTIGHLSSGPELNETE